MSIINDFKFVINIKIFNVRNFNEPILDEMLIMTEHFVNIFGFNFTLPSALETYEVRITNLTEERLGIFIDTVDNGIEINLPTEREEENIYTWLLFPHIDQNFYLNFLF